MSRLEQKTNSEASFQSINNYSNLEVQNNQLASIKQFQELSNAGSNQSEKTIIRLNDEYLLKQIKQKLFDQQLNKYPLQQRKFFIIDRTNSIIIDTRQQQAMQKFMNKTSSSANSLHLKNLLPTEDEMITQQRKKWKSNSLAKSSVWSEHYKESDKVHESFLSAICKNNFAEFYKFMDARKNSIPIQINYKSESNWYPIHYAAMHASSKIMSCLINHPQIDINALTDFNWTALHIAAQSNKFDNCELLLHAGVCVDYKDKENNTALHYAAQFGHKDLIGLLIKNGASEWIKNVKGLLPRQLCRSEDLQKLFQKPPEEEQQVTDAFYKWKRNNFVQKMLSQKVQIKKVQNFIVQKDKNEQNKNNQYEKKENKNFEQKKNRTATQTRRKNIEKMYQLILNNKVEPISLSSFKFYKKIGEGAFGEVYVVKKLKSDKLYALKAIKKQKVIGTALIRYIQTQKQVLSHINHPFIVKLYYAFQTQTFLFLVMDYCEGGDLSRLLQKKQKLQENIVRMYAAQILLGIQALHKNMIIYRDLKPDNIVLDKDGHACITDFGLSKKTNDLNTLNKSFCGTPAYLPLQIINNKGHTRMVDWYEYGVVLYELLAGIPPFYADTKNQLYNKVRQGVIRFPKNSSQTFRDLIKKLLAQNPIKRLGFENDANSIKQHQWFKDVDWNEVQERRQIMPPLQTKTHIPNEPIKTKFTDTKNEKFSIPSWSFIS